MTIKEKFVPTEELLDLFGVQRNATLKRMLDRNSIPYILDYKKNPLVLRSALESSNASPDEEVKLTPTLSWED